MLRGGLGGCRLESVRDERSTFAGAETHDWPR